MGKTKVFLKRDAFDILESLRGQKKAAAATKIAATVRMFLDRAALLRLFPELLNGQTTTEEPEPFFRQHDSTIDYCAETYESSMAIALRNVARNSRRSLMRRPQEYKWVNVDGRWVKNRNVA